MSEELNLDEIGFSANSISSRFSSSDIEISLVVYICITIGIFGEICEEMGAARPEPED